MVNLFFILHDLQLLVQKQLVEDVIVHVQNVVLMLQVMHLIVHVLQVKLIYH